MLTEHARVHAELLPFFYSTKIAMALLSYALGFYFVRRPANDAGVAVLMCLMAVYTVINNWFLPLYEFAYFECAIACAFLHPRRRWIFPICWGAGAAGIIYSYQLQADWHWVKPAAAQSDWIWSIFFLFAVAWVIHQFALRQLRRETEKRLRYSLIGRESTRLVHDLKGLLGSPLMLLESLKSARDRKDTDYIFATADLLQQDLVQVREVLAQLNRLVIINNALVPTDITGLLQEAANVLRYRLHGVEIEYPEPRTLPVAPERLHSVFFNLYLNSVEAFQQNEVQNPRIRIFWKKNVLNFCDNAGGIKLLPGQASTKRTGSGGLGLEIILSELESMSVAFRLYDEEEGIRATLSFNG